MCLYVSTSKSFLFRSIPAGNHFSERDSNTSAYGNTHGEIAKRCPQSHTYANSNSQSCS